MNLIRLVLRSFFFHWRGNSTVLLGVFVGAAVLTGALLVGDSLRGSLRDMAEEQLGWVDQALLAGRFLRADIIDNLPAKHAAAAIIMQGSATREESSASQNSVSRRAGGVSIMGVDDRFWITPPG